MDPVSILGSCISCLCTTKCIHDPLARQYNYLRGHREKVKELEKKMEELRAQENDIKMKLETANVQDGNEPEAIALWRNRVQNVENEVHSLMNTVEEEQRCLNGCFPNYRSRLKLGKYIEEKTRIVTELLEKGQFSDDQLIDLQQHKGMPLPTTTLVGKTTAERNLEQIWEYFMDDNIGKIGIYGMGGVGKTTIMKHIHNRLLKESTRFDMVIWITVSKDCKLEKLQNDIGKALNVVFSNYNDEKIRARELLAALKLRKKFVLILDDMWKAFSLENVGIPEPTRENGCKILLTTRLQGVCRVMETQTTVEVRVLSKEEAWDLFRGKVGEDVLHSPDVQVVAKNVAKECGGLPLALIVVGRALRQVDDVMEWKNALNELRASRANFEDLEDEVFKSLRFSFIRLKEEIQACFLYCALYPEDEEIKVEELIEQWIGVGFINSDLSRDEQLCKGISILNELKDACMLEDSRKDCVKMHDLVRDLAIRIQIPSCIIKARFGLRKAPGDEEWIENLERVSLIGNDIEHLTGEPKCHNLSSLLLQQNPLRDISHPFFQHMHNLRVVNLSGTLIKFLPKSLVDLENLRALLLSNCNNLKNLPSLANLKSLRTLDLSNSPVTELPLGMEMLVNLRVLDLSGCFLQKMFPAKLLQNLSLLDKVSVVGESFRWGSNAEEEAEVGACGEELISATHIKIRQVHFLKGEIFRSFTKFGHLQQLTTFTVSHGKKVPEWKPSEFGKNRISIIGDKELNVGGTWPVLPDTTHELFMKWCHTLTRLSMCLPKSAQLKVLFINDCDNMERIVMTGENILPGLEIMDLRFLPKLSCLCKGGVATLGVLSSLKVLNVHNCHNLKKLLTRGLLQHLRTLEDLTVWSCHGMEEIIADEGGEEGEDDDKERGGDQEIISTSGAINNNNVIITATLPRLKSLVLAFLYSVNSICSKGVLVCNSLHYIQIYCCGNLKKLPIVSTEYKNGETLFGPPPALRKKLNGNIKWRDPLTSDHPDADADAFFQLANDPTVEEELLQRDSQFKRSIAFGGMSKRQFGFLPLLGQYTMAFGGH